MVKQDIFTLTIGGQAGQGIKAAGLLLAKVATRLGKHVYTYSEYPSLIKGGHNLTQVSISGEAVTAPRRSSEFWIALDQNTLNVHLTEFKDGCSIIFDEGRNYDLTKINKKADLIPIPLNKLAKDAGGSLIISNTVALGVAIALLGANLQIFKDLLSGEFEQKGEELVKINHQAAENGYNYALEHFGDKKKAILIKEGVIEQEIVANANDTVALGAIAAGLQFAAIYPMSPISDILHVLAANQEKFGFIYKQPEDEISAINMAIGASIAGARSMTATSGGGFSLMVEGLGLAAMIETPVVIIDGMRPGPASGLPTWSGQGDLRFALHAHQGDFPRIVLAPGDAIEAFYLTMQAFNLADKYQTPVIILIDKNLCEHDQSMSIFSTASYEIDRGKFTTKKEDGFERYKLSPDGISLRSVPGSGNYFIANSYEHTTVGYDSEKIEDINDQMRKRMTKIVTCATNEDNSPKLYGPADADVTIVSWGSNKGSIIQALKDFPNVNYLHITWMSPFPAEAVRTILEKARRIVNIECNYTASLSGIIKENTGIEITDNFLKYDGRPFFPEEIGDKLKSILGG
ncbi:MAG: 2-oxoacid:acceptor oxidoreductase subunit alpha [Candidatus Levybacteria bacterium]|nr:2-oxoacid:acceptor oxidoreductase subunit alpha [Candidatus Levybacteria bacterium]